MSTHYLIQKINKKQYQSEGQPARFETLDDPEALVYVKVLEAKEYGYSIVRVDETVIKFIC